MSTPLSNATTSALTNAKTNTTPSHSKEQAVIDLTVLSSPIDTTLLTDAIPEDPSPPSDPSRNAALIQGDRRDPRRAVGHLTSPQIAADELVARGEERHASESAVDQGSAAYYSDDGPTTYSMSRAAMTSDQPNNNFPSWPMPETIRLSPLLPSSPTGRRSLDSQGSFETASSDVDPVSPDRSCALRRAVRAIERQDRPQRRSRSSASRQPLPVEDARFRAGSSEAGPPSSNHANDDPSHGELGDRTIFSAHDVDDPRMTEVTPTSGDVVLLDRITLDNPETEDRDQSVRRHVYDIERAPGRRQRSEHARISRSRNLRGSPGRQSVPSLGSPRSVSIGQRSHGSEQPSGLENHHARRYPSLQSNRRTINPVRAQIDADAQLARSLANARIPSVPRLGAHPRWLYYHLWQNPMMQQLLSFSDRRSAHVHHGPEHVLDADLQRMLENVGNVPTPAGEAFIRTLPLTEFSASSQELKENNSCSICQCDYDEGEWLTHLPCLHMYHPACIEEWLKSKSVCPLCRMDVRTRQ